MKPSLAAIISLFIAAPLSAQQEGLSQLQAAIQAGQTANPGAPFEGSRAALTPATRLQSEATPATLPGLVPSRTRVAADSYEAPKTAEEKPAVEIPGAVHFGSRLGEAINHHTCRTFFSCLGTTLLSPVSTTLGGAIDGVEYGVSHENILAAIGEGIVGAPVGLAAGVIVTPLSLGTGLFKTFKELLAGDVFTKGESTSP